MYMHLFKKSSKTKGKKGKGKEGKKEKQCKLYCEKLNVRILFEMSDSDAIECTVSGRFLSN